MDNSQGSSGPAHRIGRVTVPAGTDPQNQQHDEIERIDLRELAFAREAQTSQQDAQAPAIAAAAKDFNIGHATIQLERAGLPATSGYVMPAPAK